MAIEITPAMTKRKYNLMLMNYDSFQSERNSIVSCNRVYDHIFSIDFYKCLHLHSGKKFKTPLAFFLSPTLVAKILISPINANLYYDLRNRSGFVCGFFSLKILYFKQRPE